jgi:hypothetical protein
MRPVPRVAVAGFKCTRICAFNPDVHQCQALSEGRIHGNVNRSQETPPACNNHEIYTSKETALACLASVGRSVREMSSPRTDRKRNNSRRFNVNAILISKALLYAKPRIRLILWTAMIPISILIQMSGFSASYAKYSSKRDVRIRTQWAHDCTSCDDGCAASSSDSEWTRKYVFLKIILFKAFSDGLHFLKFWNWGLWLSIIRLLCCILLLVHLTIPKYIFVFIKFYSNKTALNAAVVLPAME